MKTKLMMFTLAAAAVASILVGCKKNDNNDDPAGYDVYVAGNETDDEYANHPRL